MTLFYSSLHQLLYPAAYSLRLQDRRPGCVNFSTRPKNPSTNVRVLEEAVILTSSLVVGGSAETRILVVLQWHELPLTAHQG